MTTMPDETDVARHAASYGVDPIRVRHGPRFR